MRTGKSSTTAELVAFWRALGHEGHTRVPSFSDPHARALLGPRWAKRFTRVNAKLAERKARRGEADSSRWDWLLVRVAVLDRLTADALAGGARQLVILGAGLDTRAWRLPGLEGVRVFEADHPDTQALKRDRARAMPAAVSPPRFVAVDFARDQLAGQLARAGHRADRPTVWLCEGVVMYLTDAAVRGMLGDVAACSAPGSTLLLHYHTPTKGWWMRMVRAVIFRVLGEPQVGTRTPDAMAGFARDAGFCVTGDLSLAEQARLVGAANVSFNHGTISRILTASNTLAEVAAPCRS